MTLAVEKTTAGPSVVLSLAGRIRGADLAVLEAVLLDEINDGCRSLLVDLSSVDHLVGAALPKLVSTGRRLKGYGGRFAVAGPFRPEVRELFERADLANDLRIVATRRHGVQWLTQQGQLQSKAKLARELLAHGDEPASKVTVKKRRDLKRLSRLAARILNA